MINQLILNSKNEVEVTNYTQLKEFNVSYKGNELRLEYINK